MHFVGKYLFYCRITRQKENAVR